MTIGGSNLCFVNKNNYLCMSYTHDARDIETHSFTLKYKRYNSTQ